MRYRRVTSRTQIYNVTAKAKLLISCWFPGTQISDVNGDIRFRTERYESSLHTRTISLRSVLILSSPICLGTGFFRFPDQNYVRVSYLYHISTAYCTFCIQTVSLTWSTNLLQEQLPYTFRITSSHSLIQHLTPSGLCPWNFFSNTQGLRLYIKVKDICSQPYNKPRYCCEGFSGAFANMGKVTITFVTPLNITHQQMHQLYIIY